MVFRTISAQFPGTCKRCKGPIHAGQRIRYGGGRGMTWHFKNECGPDAEQAEHDAERQAEYRMTPEYQMEIQGYVSAP